MKHRKPVLQGFGLHLWESSSSHIYICIHMHMYIYLYILLLPKHYDGSNYGANSFKDHGCLKSFRLRSLAFDKLGAGDLSSGRAASLTDACMPPKNSSMRDFHSLIARAED